MKEDPSKQGNIIPCTGRLNVAEISIIHKVMYRFNAISKFQKGFVIWYDTGIKKDKSMEHNRVPK
jgi:hypothetical protein